jgi:hypothetical protein
MDSQIGEQSVCNAVLLAAWCIQGCRSQRTLYPRAWRTACFTVCRCTLILCQMVLLAVRSGL